MYYLRSENKSADQQCSCAFVFAYADRWLSDVAALMYFHKTISVLTPDGQMIGLVYLAKSDCNCY